MRSATSDIGEAFQRCRRQERAAFIPFVVAGDPDFDTSVELIVEMGRTGADVIEIGIPYSDPLADGPTIQRAAQRALAGGMSLVRSMELAKAAKALIPHIPLLGFTYYNPLYVRGLARAAKEFAHAGLCGVIVPDLPPQEAGPLLDAFVGERLAVVMLVAPTTPDERARGIAELCTDFVYVVSRTGVTGADGRGGEAARGQVQRVRALTDKPLAVGFGVASAPQAAAVAAFADGVIVGSAIVDRIAAARSKADLVEDVRRLCSQLSRACSHPVRSA